MTKEGSLMFRLARRGLALGPAGWVDLVILSILATLIEVGLRTRPMPQIARMLRVRVTGDNAPSSGQPMSPKERRRRRIVEMMSRHWPFVDHDGLCLRRSLLFGWIFRARNPVLRIGVAKVDGTFSAHAWLELEGAAIGADAVHRRFP